MSIDDNIKRDIIEIGRRVWIKGWVAANDGNITVKTDDGIWATPTGVSKGFLTPDMLIKLDFDGNVIEGTWKPTSELKMHLRVYKKRPDVRSVLHAHPPVTTSYAIAGIPLDKLIMPEAVISLGIAPIAEYGTPSTEELPDNVEKYLSDYDALMLENHGALTYGADLNTAYYKMETLEYFAKITLITYLLGKRNELSEDRVKGLIGIRKKFGLKGKYPEEQILKKFKK